ncbi:hypothetical protein GCM10023149_49060 [Mucilaginibacter gynuensis]|uniref:histidine kinase n=1 Tax=Mucilaginibacter gynuensis TaxID=1302236 RepID=A0ABP8HGA4_9SPHI
MSFFGNIKGQWERVTGSTAEFALEFRIFHSLCFISIVALAYNVPFNYFIGLPLIALVSFVVLLIFSYLFYLSRVKRKVAPSTTWYAVFGNVLFAVNYFINSGTYGPTDLLMALSLLLIICTAPKKHYKIWLIVSLVMVLTLHFIEYYYPELVPYTYTDRESRFFDLTSAYIVTVVLMYYTVVYIRKNYDFEKRRAEERALAIEEQSRHIIAQKDELERLNTEKSKLIGIIAHDLRSPLSSIQSYLELITEHDIDEQERIMVKKELLKITRNTTDMLGKLLAWSKSQMDGVDVQLAPVNLRDALFNTLELEKTIGQKKNIIVEHDIDWDISIIADADMLQLVIRNLVSNAIKFTRSGGNVNIKAKLIGAECWLIIRDNGGGIPLEQQEELFSLKAKSTFGTANEKGVGLGLLLCKEFTELQGGKLWFESTPGEGTVFYVAMPAQKIENATHLSLA